jgi:hypothetical protein
MTGPHPVAGDADAATRRLHVNLESLAHVLDVFGQTTEQLHLDEPFTQLCGTPAQWRASGRLYGRRTRFARGTRVEIELSAWSRRATELRVRPASRRAQNWGAARQRRYFDLAYDVVDRLVPAVERAVRRHERRLRAAQSMRVLAPIGKSA